MSRRGVGVRHAVLVVLRARVHHDRPDVLPVSAADLDPGLVRRRLDEEVAAFVAHATATGLPASEARWARRWLLRIDNSLGTAWREREEASGIPQLLAEAAWQFQRASLEAVPVDRWLRLAHVLELLRDARELRARATA